MHYAHGDLPLSVTIASDIAARTPEEKMKFGGQRRPFQSPGCHNFNLIWIRIHRIIRGRKMECQPSLRVLRSRKEAHALDDATLHPVFEEIHDRTNLLAALAT